MRAGPIRGGFLAGGSERNGGASARSLSLSARDREKEGKKANAAGHTLIIDNFAEAIGAIEKILFTSESETADSLVDDSRFERDRDATRPRARREEHRANRQTFNAKKTIVTDAERREATASTDGSTDRVPRVPTRMTTVVDSLRDSTSSIIRRRDAVPTTRQRRAST